MLRHQFAVPFGKLGRLTLTAIVRVVEVQFSTSESAVCDMSLFAQFLHSCMRICLVFLLLDKILTYIILGKDCTRTGQTNSHVRIGGCHYHLHRPAMLCCVALVQGVFVGRVYCFEHA